MRFLSLLFCKSSITFYNCPELHHLLVSIEKPVVCLFSRRFWGYFLCLGHTEDRHNNLVVAKNNFPFFNCIKRAIQFRDPPHLHTCLTLCSFSQFQKPKKHENKKQNETDPLAPKNPQRWKSKQTKDQWHTKYQEKSKWNKEVTKIQLSSFYIGKLLLACHGACPEMWLIDPVTLHWRKLIFPLPANINYK